jgi:hypothetical protein
VEALGGSVPSKVGEAASIPRLVLNEDTVVVSCVSTGALEGLKFENLPRLPGNNVSGGGVFAVVVGGNAEL